MAGLRRNLQEWLMALAASLVSVLSGWVIIFLIAQTVGFDSYSQSHAAGILDALFITFNAGIYLALWFDEHALGVSSWALIHGHSTGFLILAVTLNMFWWFVLLKLLRLFRTRKRRRNR